VLRLTQQMKSHKDRVWDGLAAPPGPCLGTGKCLQQQPRSLLVKAEPVRHRSRLPATSHAELGEDVGDMQAGGLFGDEQGLAGVVAAILPARRVARLDVLAAIATE
jgi:hypothetical protein